MKDPPVHLTSALARRIWPHGQRHAAAEPFGSGPDKTVFEYWTRALSYLPVESMRFYVRHMRRGGRMRARGGI